MEELTVLQVQLLEIRKLRHKRHLHLPYPDHGVLLRPANDAGRSLLRRAKCVAFRQYDRQQFGVVANDVSSRCRQRIAAKEAGSNPCTLRCPYLKVPVANHQCLSQRDTITLQERTKAGRIGLPGIAIVASNDVNKPVFEVVTRQQACNDSRSRCVRRITGRTPLGNQPVQELGKPADLEIRLCRVPIGPKVTGLHSSTDSCFHVELAITHDYTMSRIKAIAEYHRQEARGVWLSRIGIIGCQGITEKVFHAMGGQQLKQRGTPSMRNDEVASAGRDNVGTDLSGIREGWLQRRPGRIIRHSIALRQ